MDKEVLSRFNLSLKWSLYSGLYRVYFDLKFNLGINLDNNP